MPPSQSTDRRFSDLKSEVKELQGRNPSLSNEDSFCAWFIRAYLVDREEEAVGALTGAAKDKDIDAVVVDENAHRAFVIQSKYRQKLLATTEARNNVMALADLGHALLGTDQAFDQFVKEIDPLVRDRAKVVRDRCLKRNYKLDLYYITTGRCSGPLEEDARVRARQGTAGRAALMVFDGRRVLGILDDYLDGVAPPVPSLDLPLEAVTGYVSSGNVVQRYDTKSGIESWVFSAKGGDIGDLFKQAGVRVFARNVRGFLGNTAINRAMKATLETRPEYFLYFNNGVTIVCDDAEKVDSKGASLLRVANPQIINGQQTTRMLAAEDKRAEKASVLVRVIRIPRDDHGSGDRFEQLVSQIVEATNWQNEIRASDLMSNDRQQIVIERELRKLGYQYLRKRQTKGEARRAAGSRAQFIVKKDEFAQAVGACELDPAVVRGGKEGLFEERYYKTVFPNGDPSFYLPRFWLMRRVNRLARGNPERTYARWVALNFLWGDLARDLRSKARSRAFRAINENPRAHAEIIGQLDKLIARVVLGVVRFYRVERGKGSSALDPSAFFNSLGRAKQFEAFWASSGNPHRGPFDRVRTTFVSALVDIDA